MTYETKAARIARIAAKKARIAANAPAAPARTVCSNCGQWRHPYKGASDCLNRCVGRGFAR